MRLMIVGQLEGYISAAGKIALQRGAKVIHCEDIQQALGALRNGKGADLAMVDVKQRIAEFVETLKAERIHMPDVVALPMANPILNRGATHVITRTGRHLPPAVIALLDHFIGGIPSRTESVPTP